MMNFILVGIGGALGSISRYSVGKYINSKNKVNFPIATLLINIFGAFLLGFTVKAYGNSRAYILIGDGFLGAFTTFSTFMYEGVNLLMRKRMDKSVIYLLLSLVFGILGFIAGAVLAK